MNSTKLKGCFSKNSDDWSTPEDIYKHFINDIGCIDPCPLNSKEDNLNKIYISSYLFINPPYSQIKKWVNFVINNINNGAIVYLLIPARTDTIYFHDLVNLPETYKIIYFIKGRLKFGKSNLSAPFPSILIKIYKKNNGGLPDYTYTYYIKKEEIFNIY